MTFAESEVEEAALDWLHALGYQVLHGPAVAPGEPASERGSYEEAFLPERLRQALTSLNPSLPVEALEEAFRKVTRPDQSSLIGQNHAFHRALVVKPLTVEYRARSGEVCWDQVRLADFDHPEANDWLAVNQFTVTSGQHKRRADVVLFVNGLPLAVLELKNPADENATIWSAYNQLQTYKQEIPALFAYNEALVVSDGLEARLGTLTASRERFAPWRTITGEEPAPTSLPQLQVLIEGVFEKRRFLDLVRYFTVFEDDSHGNISKKVAGYHQFHAVNLALQQTLRAAAATSETRGRQKAELGDGRVGVIWHTQGSGKSLTMAFYAGRVVLEPAMENPTLVVLTDRNDLDDQLYGTFAGCHELLQQKPARADSRAELMQLLRVASGGVVFTTIQKFFPEQKGDRYPRLSDRRNIVVIADEAHRSQYEFIDGFARHMRDALPNASFIGFTGTPIETTDANTRAVFGDYISIYDIQRAVEDGATVPIYYEGRLAQIELKEDERPRLNPDFEEATEGEELAQKERLKTKWAALEALVGSQKRVGLIAEDLIRHFEQRLEALDGKALVVCMSRRICVELYDALVVIRPQWHDPNDAKGAVKIVMTGSASDPPGWQGHIRNKPRREALAARFKDPADPLRIVIVRDMWLTGFDVPCLHTMYLDKPMRGHGLMQAIARVNRVFRDKPGGHVVDYLGLGDELRQAMATYTASGGKGKTAIDQEEAVALMLEKHEVCTTFFHGFDWSPWLTGTPQARLGLLPSAQEHILAQENGKVRLLSAVTELSQAFALAVPHPEALRIRDDVGFFQAVRAVLAKATVDGKKTTEEIDFAIRQLVSRAVIADQVVDLFTAAGLKKPDISILSEEFLAEVRGLPQKNLAVELLRKLLQGEVKARSRRNLVAGRSFAELLERAIRGYQNRALTSVQVIEELIRLAKEMREADRRGEALGLGVEEVAFYDALETNDSAVAILGDETLRTIARDLVDTVRRNVSIDWTAREHVRAKLRVMVKRVLRKYGYPPDKQEKATQTVLAQAELLCADWA